MPSVQQLLNAAACVQEVKTAHLDKSSHKDDHGSADKTAQPRSYMVLVDKTNLPDGKDKKEAVTVPDASGLKHFPALFAPPSAEPHLYCRAKKEEDGCHVIKIRDPRADIKKVIFWDLDETLFFTNEFLAYLRKKEAGEDVSDFNVNDPTLHFIIQFECLTKLLTLSATESVENVLVTARVFEGEKNVPNGFNTVYSILNKIGLHHFCKIIFTNATFKCPVLKREHEVLLGASVLRGNSMLVEDNKDHYQPCLDAGFKVGIVDPNDSLSHLNDVWQFMGAPCIEDEPESGLELEEQSTVFHIK